MKEVSSDDARNIGSSSDVSALLPGHEQPGTIIGPTVGTAQQGIFAPVLPESPRAQSIVTTEHDSRAASKLELTLVALPYFAVVYTGAAVVAQCMPLLLSYGATPTLVTVLFVCVSLAALVLQPLIGSLSDRSESKFGRRRPYIGFLFVVMMASQVVYVTPAAFIEEPCHNHTSGGGERGSEHQDYFWGIFLVVGGGLIMSICVNAVQVNRRTFTPFSLPLPALGPVVHTSWLLSLTLFKNPSPTLGLRFS
jgi:hypothetical protein